MDDDFFELCGVLSSEIIAEAVDADEESPNPDSLVSIAPVAVNDHREDGPGVAAGVVGLGGATGDHPSLINATVADVTSLNDLSQCHESIWDQALSGGRGVLSEMEVTELLSEGEPRVAALRAASLLRTHYGLANWATAPRGWSCLAASRRVVAALIASPTARISRATWRALLEVGLSRRFLIYLFPFFFPSQIWALSSRCASLRTTNFLPCVLAARI